MLCAQSWACSKNPFCSPWPCPNPPACLSPPSKCSNSMLHMRVSSAPETRLPFYAPVCAHSTQGACLPEYPFLAPPDPDTLLWAGPCPQLHGGAVAPSRVLGHRLSPTPAISLGGSVPKARGLGVGLSGRRNRPSSLSHWAAAHTCPGPAPAPLVAILADWRPIGFFCANARTSGRRSWLLTLLGPGLAREAVCGA